MKLGLLAIDGTKIQANASKHKAMSYARMLEMEQRLQDEIDALLSRAEQTDTAEDARFGSGGREEDLARGASAPQTSTGVHPRGEGPARGGSSTSQGAVAS